MRKKKVVKKIPLFKTEAEEAAFWDRVDSTKYFSGKGGVVLRMPKRTTTISLRIPIRLLDRIKKIANHKDVPYQSLIKIFLDKDIVQEIKRLKSA